MDPRIVLPTLGSPPGGAWRSDLFHVDAGQRTPPELIGQSSPDPELPEDFT
ncbi:hypothetical protein NQZ68_019945 [Dissostichus eleginoides]|nr:hypothetical protein NQZ68_019945 [Dissostichus eleginoides]